MWPETGPMSFSTELPFLPLKVESVPQPADVVSRADMTPGFQQLYIIR